MINSISSNGIKPMNYARTDKSNDAQIKALRQQEASIQKQIDSIKNSKQDPKTKQELIKPLESQIQSIEGQIQQAQIDQVSNKNGNSNSGSKVNTENNEKFQKDNIFLSMSSTYNQVKQVNSIRKNLKGKANELNSDASFDEMTGNYKMANIERAEAAKDQGKANGLQSKIGKLNSDMNKSVKNEINKENKEENMEISDPGGTDKDLEKSSEKASGMDLKGDFQNDSDINKKQSIDALA
ncbi:vacuolar-type H+-ATPase subunit I/STV1 [Clostridium algifaecis]|uniref:Vacuolar-type H+-ATPase subunit I/STV1 n=1 Tax=Clostridium algifaecis TaxID=1472040 RepID=A0ABS4KMS3_9CLOT|nr:FlxA-like family protein [Clostridium algifaecis]MBP2031337.1 vacuolar-type H+-ATPase subunit I/STV1 [Clostridium algifaecis]